MSLFVLKCSTNEVTKSEIEEISKIKNDLELNVEKTYCWINSMPGSQPKFHISGKFAIPKSENADIADIKLMYVKVFQDSKEIYYIQPKIIQNLANNSLEITYSTIQGLLVKRELNKKNKLTVELIFSLNDNEYKYFIQNVIIEEAL